MLFYSYFKTLVGKEVRGRDGRRVVEVARRRWRLADRVAWLWTTGPHRHRHVGQQQQVIVELKNDLAISGTLHSVDQYLSVKLTNVKVVNESKFPHMVRSAVQHTAPQTVVGVWCCATRAGPCRCVPVPRLQMSVKNCFIRGSVVRYVQVRRTGGEHVRESMGAGPGGAGRC